ncbi:MAG: glycosyltransferase family 4 protein [Bacteroidales bacterium]|nr:glycosyltransferase family 4 protein [Bacteroidales bacterium]
MRIGYDAKRAFSNYSGLGNYSRFVISNMCKFYPGEEYYLYTPGISDCRIFTPPENARVIRPASIAGKLYRSYWRTYRISHWLSNDGVTIYHGLSNEIPNGIHRNGVRSVITIHDLIFLKLPRLYPAVDRFSYLQKVRYGARYADKIVAVSRQTKEDIVELLGIREDKIHVIYQGCSQDYYHTISGDTAAKIRTKYDLPAAYLLYVGTIEERKNLLRIIEAIHHGKIDIPLIVVGKKTGYFKRVLQYIKKYNLKRIRFLENVPSADLPAIYQLSMGLIYPSTYEGFGIPVIEALNSGIPVVTTRGGCLEETAGGGGLLVDPDNKDEMIHAIRQITEDEPLRNRLISRGLEHVLQFREEQTIPALHNLYLECLR